MTSVTMPGLQSSDMCHIYGKWCQRSFWHQLALVSCGFHL